MATEEGRAVRKPSDGTYSYEYNMKDHLGNVRVSFDKNPATGQARLIQEDEFYAFGLNAPLYNSGTKNNYLYNGKELQTALTNEYDYGARFYDPVIGRWHVVDKMAEHSKQISTSPYAYAGNNPISRIDPDGNCWPCVIIRGAAFLLEAITVSDVIAAGGVATTALIATNGVHQYNKNNSVSVQDNTSVYKPKLQPILKAEDSSRSDKKTKQTESNNDNTYNRVKVRKGTKEKVAENQPKNGEGQMLDPNTGQVLDPERTDLGHKPGNEWRTRKEQHKAKGSTRKEVIEEENNPDIYQYEDRSSNRSRRYEKKL